MKLQEYTRRIDSIRQEIAESNHQAEHHMGEAHQIQAKAGKIRQALEGVNLTLEVTPDDPTLSNTATSMTSALETLRAAETTARQQAEQCHYRVDELNLDLSAAQADLRQHKAQEGQRFRDLLPDAERALLEAMTRVAACHAGSTGAPAESLDGARMLAMALKRAPRTPGGFVLAPAVHQLIDQLREGFGE